jgi:lysophospholipase L1-like esterase
MTTPAILAASLAIAAAAAAGSVRANDARCATLEPLLTARAELPVTHARLGGSAPLVIVAIGSSSTLGHGASAPQNTYPARLEAALRAARPGQSIAVLNRGIGGETAAQTVARFDRDVLAHEPHLVLWQAGANDSLRGVDLDAFAATLDRGLEWLRARRFEVVLIPPQYAPRTATAARIEAYLQRMREAGTRHGVPVFRRYAIMRALGENPAALATMLGNDGLHLNDLGYRCLAEQVAAAIAPPAPHARLPAALR